MALTPEEEAELAELSQPIDDAPVEITLLDEL